ncbi:hypothetical protein MUK42_30766 [Musa troglodytarum]|uniref:Transmembrane protein n=1 Tax=Musa troglodytarum TaxID=320322 RepID=A0A9E7KC27_9LILI|nr:hypothetical protein MUK42_30766 [Musa troglodytarum]
MSFLSGSIWWAFPTSLTLVHVKYAVSISFCLSCVFVSRVNFDEGKDEQ